MSRRQCSIQNWRDLAPFRICSQLEPSTSPSRGPERTIWTQHSVCSTQMLTKAGCFQTPAAPQQRARGSSTRGGTAVLLLMGLHQNLHTAADAGLLSLFFNWIEHTALSTYHCLPEAWVVVISFSNSCWVLLICNSFPHNRFEPNTRCWVKWFFFLINWGNSLMENKIKWRLTWMITDPNQLTQVFHWVLLKT